MGSADVPWFTGSDLFMITCSIVIVVSLIISLAYALKWFIQIKLRKRNFSPSVDATSFDDGESVFDKITEEEMDAEENFAI